MTFYTGFVVTERSICKPREALNKYLANLKACVLHAKGLSSSYDSFCFLVINTVLIALAITTATCLTASVSENAEAHLKLSLPPRVYAYAKKPVANNSHSQACDSYLQKLFDTLASHARYNYHFLVHRTKDKSEHFLPLMRSESCPTLPSSGKCISKDQRFIPEQCLTGSLPC